MFNDTKSTCVKCVTLCMLYIFFSNSHVHTGDTSQQHKFDLFGCVVAEPVAAAAAAAQRFPAAPCPQFADTSNRVHVKLTCQSHAHRFSLCSYRVASCSRIVCQSPRVRSLCSHRESRGFLDASDGL